MKYVTLKLTILFGSLVISQTSNKIFAQLAGAYWNFNDLNTTTWTTASPNVISGLLSANLVRTGSILNNYNNTSLTGPTNFTAFDSSVHLFNSDTGNRRSMAWDPGSTGNSFTLQLNTTGYENFTVSFDYRRSTSGTSPTDFSALEYSLDSGTTWINISGYPDLGTASNTYTGWSFSLGSVAAINDVSNVWLRWTFPATAGNNFRIDNVQITGTPIPEPRIMIPLAVAALILMVLKHRKHCLVLPTSRLNN